LMGLTRVRSEKFDMKVETQKILNIFSEVFAEKPLTISPIIAKGFVNQVFRVETNKAKFILRINAPNSLDEYEKELWATDQAIEKNIPVPKIVNIGIYDDHAYSIQEYIKGVEGRELLTDKTFIWKKLGEYAGRIHSIKVGGFGLRLSDLTKGNSQESWLKYLNYNIGSLNENDELLKLNVLTKAQSNRARKLFENLRSQKFNFGLNHGDLSLKNTIIDEFGTIHLIDWGSSEASIVPNHELIQLLKMQIEENDPDKAELKAFLEGYGIDGEGYQKMVPDLESLLLLRAFDKLRWAIDWKIAELENYVFHAQQVVERVLI
jgi:Ser/Thr protein kinase RdoA (MazF antagonist)